MNEYFFLIKTLFLVLIVRRVARMKNDRGQSCSFMHTQGRQRRGDVTDPQWQIERFVYTQVAIQTGDASSIRKLRERVQLKYTKTNVPTDQCSSLSLFLFLACCHLQKEKQRERGMKVKGELQEHVI